MNRGNFVVFFGRTVSKRSGLLNSDYSVMGTGVEMGSRAVDSTVEGISQ